VKARAAKSSEDNGAESRMAPLPRIPLHRVRANGVRAKAHNARTQTERGSAKQGAVAITLDCVSLYPGHRHFPPFCRLFRRLYTVLPDLCPP
jgi:hypothetical protein